jgi:hypothetical protein
VWFVDHAGNTVGPVDPAAARQLIASGAIRVDTLIWQQGWADWVPAQKVFGGLLHAPPVPPRAPHHIDPRATWAGPAERAVTGAHHTLTRYIATFGPIAAALSTFIDFVQPIVALTRPITIGAFILAGILWLTARAAPALRERLLGVSRFFLLLSACSAGWWALQSVLPEGKSGGALVELVPGAHTIQETLVKPLARVEEQTKRVGDLLETQAREQREAEEEAKRQMAAYERQQAAHEKERTDAARRIITDAGYSVDPDGYVKAIGQGFSQRHQFDQLKIPVTPEALTKALHVANDELEMAYLTAYVRSNVDLMGFVRPIAKAFAIAYAKYHYSAYGDRLVPDDLSVDDHAKLKVVKVAPQTPLIKLDDCNYYEGVYRFVQPFGTLEGPYDLSRFGERAEAFAKFPQKCRYGSGAGLRGVPQCHARLLIASAYEGQQVTVIKVLQVLPQ